MQYDELSDKEQKIVDNTVNLVRGSAAEMAAIWNRLKAIADDENAVNLVLSLDAEGTIPNASGLAGSDHLTRQEVQDLFGLLDGIRTTHDTPENRAAMSKAAGVNAILRS